MADRARFAKNTGFQFALQIAKYIFPYLTLPYLTRTLGAEAYAVRAYVLAAMSFMLVFLDFGFNSYGIKAIADAHDDLEQECIESSAITYLRLLFCIVGAVALVPITLFIPIMAANPLYVAISYLTVCAKALLPDFFFQGKEEMAIITKRFVLSEAVATALVFLIIKGPESLLWVPVLETLAAVIALVWSWASVVFDYKITMVKVPVEKLVSVIEGSAVFFIATAATTVFSSLTTLMIGYYITDKTQISFWSVAMTAVTAVQALYAPIATSLYPHMVKNKDYTLLKNLLLVGMPVDIIGTIVFSQLGETIMLVLGGPEYVPGAYLIPYIAPIFVFSFPAVMIGYPLLAAVGEVKELTVTSVVSALFNILGLAVLVWVDRFTMPAIAVLRCCTEAILLASRMYYVYRYFSRMRKEGTN